MILRQEWDALTRRFFSVRRTNSITNTIITNCEATIAQSKGGIQIFIEVHRTGTGAITTLTPWQEKQLASLKE